MQCMIDGSVISGDWRVSALILQLSFSCAWSLSLSLSLCCTHSLSLSFYVDVSLPSVTVGLYVLFMKSFFIEVIVAHQECMCFYLCVGVCMCLCVWCSLLHAHFSRFSHDHKKEENNYRPSRDHHENNHSCCKLNLSLEKSNQIIQDWHL